MYINGEWADAANGRVFDVTNPANGEVIGQVPAGGAADADRAITAADAAFADWSATTAYGRADLLMAAWQNMTDEADALAALMTKEQGKPLKAGAAEVTYGADFLRWFAEEARRVTGEWLPSARRDQRFLSVKMPVGVVAAITPWNYPMSMLTRKMGPALAGRMHARVEAGRSHTSLCQGDIRVLPRRGRAARGDQSRHGGGPSADR